MQPLVRNNLFKAAVLEKLHEPFAIRQLEVPQNLSVGQVLVRIKYSGVCGSQLGEQDGVKGPNKYLPHCCGHEGGGRVVASGPGVRAVKPGDHVVIHWRKGAGIESQYPKYWCPELRYEIGGGANTTWQEMSVISENRLTKIDKDIPLDIAALLGCAVCTGLGVVANDLQVKMGQSVVVIGCGGVGLNILQGCLLANAYPVIGIDINEQKLQQAIVFGATQILNGKTCDAESLLHAVKLHTNGGADFVIDTTGSAAAMQSAWNMTNKTGRVCLVAQLRHDQYLPLQTLPLHTGKTIIGSDGGGTNPTEDIPRYIKLLKAGRLNLRGLISHRTNLDGINATLDLVRAGKASRCIIEMADSR